MNTRRIPASATLFVAMALASSAASAAEFVRRTQSTEGVRAKLLSVALVQNTGGAVSTDSSITLQSAGDHGGARQRQGSDLRDRRGAIGGIGVGHRLDDDRRFAADHDPADTNGNGPMPRCTAVPHRQTSHDLCKTRDILTMPPNRPDSVGRSPGSNEGVNRRSLELLAHTMIL